MLVEKDEDLSLTDAYSVLIGNLELISAQTLSSTRRIVCQARFV